MNKKNPCFHFSLWVRRKEQLFCCPSIRWLTNFNKFVTCFSRKYPSPSLPLPHKGLEIGNSRGGGGQGIEKAKNVKKCTQYETKLWLFWHGGGCFTTYCVTRWSWGFNLFWTGMQYQRHHSPCPWRSGLKNWMNLLVACCLQMVCTGVLQVLMLVLAI